METSTPLLMEIPPRIDTAKPPRWLVEQYSGMENDIQSWYVSYFFWKWWDERQESLENTMVRARANAEARYRSLTQTNALKGATDKSIYYQLYEAKRTGWFKYFEEIEDVRELIDHMLEEAKDRDPYGGQRYQLEFLSETLLPALEQLNVPKEMVVGIAQNKAKAIRSSAVMRHILAEDGPEAKQAVEDVLKDIVDPTVSYREFDRRNRERLGRNLPQPVDGAIYLIPGGELIVIESDSAHTQAIQMALRGIVNELSISDATVLVRYLQQMLLPKSSGMKRYEVHNDEGDVYIAEGTHGVLLPDKEEFAKMAVNEVAHLAPVLRHVQHIVYVPVHILGKAIPYSELSHWISWKFSLNGSTPYKIVDSLLAARYSLPAEVVELLPEAYVSVVTSLLDGNYGFYLKVEPRMGGRNVNEPIPADEGVPREDPA